MTRPNFAVVACAAALALTASAMTAAPATASAPSTSALLSAATAAGPAAAAAEGSRGKTELKVEVEDSRVLALTDTKIRGRVNGPKRKVILELKNAYGWERVTADKSNKKGKFKLKVPTGWYGKKKLRIVVPAKNRFGKKTKYRKVKVTEGYTPIGRASDWTRLSPRYKLRYNPCEKIKYNINPSNLPADGVGIANEAIFRIELATGLNYKYAGTTKAIAFTGGSKSVTKNANLGIAWTSPSVLPSLAAKPDGSNTLAVGGVLKAQYIAKRKTYKSTRTGLSIDYTDDAVYGANRGFDNGASLGAVMMHELTHATGLGHSRRADELMAPYIDASRPALFQKGDLQGLRRNGRDGGCLSSSGNARPAQDIDVNAFMP